MSTLVRDTLSNTNDHKKWQFIKYTLLGETGHNIMTEHLRNELTPIDHLKGSDIVRLGTPFFWKNVHQALINNGSNSTELEKIRRNLLLTAFDSFFDILPDGATFTLDPGDSNIVLPRLEVFIPSKKNATLRRISSSALEIEIPEQRLHIDLHNIDPTLKIPAIRVPNGYNLQVLYAQEPALFEKEYFEDISTDTTEAIDLAQLIAKSFDLINTVSPDIASRILSMTKFFVPLIARDPTESHSLTSNRLIGVIFMSPSGDEIYGAEKIIHEFHHLELHMLMETHQFVKINSNENVFYSPWRDDPRPIEGLLHALYVFSEVYYFYRKAEDILSLKMHTERFRCRKSMLYHQIKLCLSQVPDNILTPLGQSFINSIKNFIDKEKDDSIQLPIEVKDHLNKWREMNKDLVSGIKVPDYYH